MYFNKRLVLIVLLAAPADYLLRKYPHAAHCQLFTHGRKNWKKCLLEWPNQHTMPYSRTLLLHGNIKNKHESREQVSFREKYICIESRDVKIAKTMCY